MGFVFGREAGIVSALRKGKKKKKQTNKKWFSFLFEGFV